jgi:CRISPR-associated Csx14 family protein
MNTFLATLGQRPEAITLALDELQPKYAFTQVVILHTDPQISQIGDAYNNLKMVFEQDYPGLPVHWYALCQSDRSPIKDIFNQATATQYYRAIYGSLLKYKEQHHALHLLVAGGRKAMSIYATLAASLLFTPRDKVWTILSPDELINHKGVFHAPSPEIRRQIQMVQLPMVTARILPGSIPSHLLENPENLYDRSRRVMFMGKLSPQERLLTETVLMNPYVTNEELAKLLDKSKRTVETQFRSIYNKLQTFLDFGEEISNKRQALIDLLNEE